MNAVTVVSLFAATLSMVSFVPQAIAIIRSRNTDGISLRKLEIRPGVADGLKMRSRVAPGFMLKQMTKLSNPK